MEPRRLLRTRMASLVYAVTVAEYANFRHASVALGVAQSTVSAYVKALEEELGILLFERRARGVRLTEAGRHFIEEARTGLEQLSHAVTTAGALARGEHGRLRIGVHALIPRSFLAELLARYRDDYRSIDVEIVENTAHDAVRHLHEDRIDVAFVVGAPELPDCHSRQLWTEPLVVALPERHALAVRPAVTWADLASETFLARQGGTGPQVHDHIILRLAGRWSTPCILRFDVGRDTLLSMVGQGFGITIVGAATTLVPTSGVTFLPIADEPEPVAFSAVWLPQNRSPTLRTLLALAREMSRSARRRT